MELLVLFLDGRRRQRGLGLAYTLGSQSGEHTLQSLHNKTAAIHAVVFTKNINLLKNVLRAAE
jgi:hypothetical protein